MLFTKYIHEEENVQIKQVIIISKIKSEHVQKV